MQKQILMSVVYIFHSCSTSTCYMSKLCFQETIHQSQLYEQIVSRREEKDTNKSAMNIVQGVYNLQVSLFNCPKTTIFICYFWKVVQEASLSFE